MKGVGLGEKLGRGGVFLFYFEKKKKGKGTVLVKRFADNKKKK